MIRSGYLFKTVLLYTCTWIWEVWQIDLVSLRYAVTCMRTHIVTVNHTDSIYLFSLWTLGEELMQGTWVAEMGKEISQVLFRDT